MLLFIFIVNLSAAFPQQKIKSSANADITRYTLKDGLPSIDISKIVQTKDGYLWISGIEGTYRFNGYDFERVGENFGVPEMQDIYYDSLKNILYFASPNKFISFDGNEYKVYTGKNGYKINGLPGRIITFIKADSRGHVWIGSETLYVDKRFNGGLTEFYNGKFTVYDSTDFPLDNATNFIEAPDGALIFSSDGQNTQTGAGSYSALFKNGVFKKIDPSEGISLQSAQIITGNLNNSIDNKGNLWLVCNGIDNGSLDKNTAGVLMYDGKKFHQFNDFIKGFEKYQYPDRVFYSSEMNKVFLTTYYDNAVSLKGNNKPIWEFDNGRWRPSDILDGISGEAGSIDITNFKFDDVSFTKRNKVFPELLEIEASKVNGRTKYGNLFYSIANGKLKPFDAFPGTPVSALNDHVLLSLANGFAIYYPDKSELFTEKNGVPVFKSNIGANFYPDRSGNVWISYSYTALPEYAVLRDKGLNFWNGKTLSRFTVKDGLAGGITFNTFEDDKDRIWIPTSKGVSLALPSKTDSGKTKIKFKTIPSGNNKYYNATNLLETTNGEIYAWQNFVRPASSNIDKADFYLGRFEDGKFNEIISPFSKADNSRKYQLHNLHEDNSGRLWLFGLFADNVDKLSIAPSKIRIYDGKKWSKPPDEWNVPKEQLHFAGRLKNGMYFLTLDGFYVFNGNKFVNLIDSVNSNADFRILKGASVAGTQTYIQAGNRLFIRLRERGLAVFDGTHLTYYTNRNGLPISDLYNPVSYGKDIFFSCPLGVLQISGNNFQIFGDDESIASGGPYQATMDGYGNLLEYYSGAGLFIRKIEKTVFPLRISSVVVNDDYHYINFPESLPYFKNSLVFNFAALNFKDPKQTKYTHYLEGYDKEWSKTADLPFAEYQNLPPGRYLFKVKAVTSNGISTNEASYSFIITPPWWKTFWAYGSYIIIAFGFLFSMRKYELNRKLQKAENERKTQELEEARQLQLSMLPRDIPSLAQMDIAVYLQPATEVGGDYYDFHIDLDGTLTVALGDATGHGLKAGTMVAATKSLFNNLADNEDIISILHSCNRAIKQMNLSRLSMCLMILKIKDGLLSLSSAGMPPALIYRRKSRHVEELMAVGTPLGAVKNFPYEMKSAVLEPGDIIFMMSDGYPELANVNHELLGYDRVKEYFCEADGMQPEEIIEMLKIKGSKWTGGKPPDDDVTFVVIKLK